MESQEDEVVLNELHKDLIADYLRFAKYQQGQRLKSIDYCFTNLLAFKYVLNMNIKYCKFYWFI